MAHHSQHLPFTFEQFGGQRSGRSNLPLKACGPISEYMVTGLAKEMSDIITVGNCTFRWHSQTSLGHSAQHKPLMNVSINTVKDVNGFQSVNLEISPLVSQSYSVNLPAVSWRMNVGTPGSPDIFLDTTRVFAKIRGVSDKVTIDLGSTTRFIETLKKSKDVLVFTVFTKNPADPDITNLLQDRRVHREMGKNLSNLSSIHSKLFNDPCPETVRFVFPLRSGRKKYLYALETVLRSVKYFSNLLDSEFSETSCCTGGSNDDLPSTSKKLKFDLDCSQSSPIPAHVDQWTSTSPNDSSFDTMVGEHVSGADEVAWWNGDSDDETEDPINEIEEYEMPAERFKATVVVTDTPYSTYRALLQYMFSGSLCFAPLRSTYISEKRAAKRTGEVFGSLKDFIQHRSIKVALTTCQLTPTSPKSMYVLADKLIMPELRQLAKQQILNSLTPSNIFNEIRTGMCLRYPDLRNSYIEYLKQHRQEALSSDTLQDIVISALGNSGKDTEEVVREVLQKSLLPLTPRDNANSSAPTVIHMVTGLPLASVAAENHHYFDHGPMVYEPYPNYDYEDHSDASEDGYVL